MKTLTIYYDENMKTFRRITPSKSFDGDWSGLVMALTDGKYYSYKVD